MRTGGVDFVFRSDPARTDRRVARLKAYFRRTMLDGGTFKCRHGAACRASYSGRLIEGQLHHVGQHYDLFLDGRPFRIVVMGQEYGHAHSGVSLAERRKMICKFGTERRFFAGDGFKARNSHLRATTSLLRLLLGRGLGADYEGEFITLAGKSVHLFEAFALVNFLLCSAVTNPEPASFRGGQRGQSTRVMRANCAEHVRAALTILDPTVVVAQGRAVRQWLNMVWDAVEPAHAALPLERVRLGSRSMLLASFVHPSAPTRDNWGASTRQPYLLNTVMRTVAALRAAAGMLPT
jgi:uracil-DNA glycosylase